MKRIEASSKELRKCILSGLLVVTSKLPKIRRVCLALALRLEGGAFYSHTARQIMEQRYGVRIGAYSYGGCFIPGAFPEGVFIGRYVSVAGGVRIIRRNHPVDWLSTHPFFFNHLFGFVAKDRIDFHPLAIEHDAWIGENVIITAGCKRIGIGAVVGAGAVVTKDVPDFAVVGGVPARLIKFRFSEVQQRRIISSQWWNRPVADCARWIDSMAGPLDKDGSNHPLLGLVK